ncbi:MAG: glycerate kinase family protein [Pseudoclavibacter sp.]
MVEARVKVVVVPDKFKGTLTASEAADAIALGILDVVPEAIVTKLPFADGGEGTVDAALAAGGKERRNRVSGPLGSLVDARWALLGDTAVVEMAQASGLSLLDPSPTTALDAHTEGTGELILHAVEAGATRVVLGVGGSASTDAGVGALRALGVEFFDRSGESVTGGGRDLSRIVEIDASAAKARLDGIEITLCSDVANPFAGPAGAAHVFGRQKGADDAALALLDDGLLSFAQTVKAATGTDLSTAVWGGSGGGIAGGLWALLGARTGDGVEIMAEVLRLDSYLRGADLVVVGEGSLDRQSLLGKTPVGVARRAGLAGVPCVAVAGVIDCSLSELVAHGISAAFSSSDAAPHPSASFAEPGRWVRAAAGAAMASFERDGERSSAAAAT